MRPSVVRIARLFFAAGAAILSTTASLPAQRTASAARMRHDTLPNGLEIIVAENHAVPIITASIVFRGGAMMQTDELQGVPHLFEHMLFRSYRGPERASFGDEASRAGAAYNGGTSDEYVSYTLWLPADRFGESMLLLSDLVREPRFEDRALQPERFVVRDELNRNRSEPTFLLREGVKEALWGRWYPRKNTIGNDLSLFSTNLSRLQQIYAQWYVPNNAALVISGDVSAEKVFGEARKHFARWKRQPDPLVAAPVPPPPAFDSVKALVFVHDVQTVTVNLSWRGPDLRTDRDGVLDAAALVDLLNADDSPVERNLLDTGAFQSAWFSAETYRYGSEIRFTGVTTIDNLTSALGALGTVVNQLTVTELFGPAALAAATTRRHVNDRLARENSPAMADAIGTIWASAGIDFFLAYDDLVAARTPQTIADFARKYITGRPYVIAALTPAGTQSTAERALMQFVSFMSEP